VSFSNGYANRVAAGNEHQSKISIEKIFPADLTQKEFVV
jgi:hypothetical protein